MSNSLCTVRLVSEQSAKEEKQYNEDFYSKCMNNLITVTQSICFHTLPRQRLVQGLKAGKNGMTQ